MDTADPHVLYLVMAVVVAGLVSWVVWVLVRPEPPLPSATRPPARSQSP
jgi:hypothetical protein